MRERGKREREGEGGGLERECEYMDRKSVRERERVCV